MEATAIDTEIRWGWYHDPVLNVYDFWWGEKILVSFEAIMLNFMPDKIVREIRAAT